MDASPGENLKKSFSPLPPSVVLPTEWYGLFTREQLRAFLTFLGLRSSTRTLKTELTQQLLERLEADEIARAQFFEVFTLELAVPPWEFETLLSCTTTE